jgi:hypothetical protein
MVSIRQVLTLKVATTYSSHLVTPCLNCTLSRAIKSQGGKVLWVAYYAKAYGRQRFDLALFCVYVYECDSQIFFCAYVCVPVLCGGDGIGGSAFLVSCHTWLRATRHASTSHAAGGLPRCRLVACMQLYYSLASFLSSKYTLTCCSY